jgi:ABC-2 type transport system permease protein
VKFKIQNYYLLKQMVAADFKLRYQYSVLGYLWSLIRPLALFSVLYTVFSYVLKIGNDVPHYPIYLLLGIVIWSFFLEASSTGLRAVVEKGDLIRKVNVPKFVIVIAPVFSAFVNLLFNFIVVLILAGVSRVELHFSMLLLPFLLAELLVVTIAVSFLLSALYVKFRDIAYIWELVSQVLFYTIPIIYPLSIVPERFAKLLLLNPIAQIVQDSRYVLVTKQTITTANLMASSYRLVPYLVVMGLVYVSVVYFRNNSRYFAENI